VRRINEEQRARGMGEIGVGIGLNTGMMFVGDMGSDVRRKKYLYDLYAQRVASLRTLPLDPEWDGTSRFETK
jgi:class 3 adenylate cyclase